MEEAKHRSHMLHGIASGVLGLRRQTGSLQRGRKPVWGWSGGGGEGEVLDSQGSYYAIAICQNLLNCVLRGVNPTVCNFYLQLSKLHTPDLCKSQLSGREL